MICFANLDINFSRVIWRVYILVVITLLVTFVEGNIAVDVILLVSKTGSDLTGTSKFSSQVSSPDQLENT